MFRFAKKPSSGSHSQCLAKITRYILPMYSHSDVEERDLGPPVTPLYTASHPNSSPASEYPNLDLMMASRGRNMSFYN